MKRRFFLKAAATALVGFSLFRKVEPVYEYTSLSVVEFSHWQEWPNLKPETSKLTEDSMKQAIKYLQRLES